MERKKIAVIGLKGLPAFGGAATVGENIIKQLKEKYDFTVYAVESHANVGILSEDYLQIVFKRFPLKKLNIFFYYLKSMLHCLFVARYDLIHLHHLDGAFIIPFLRLKYKVIVTSHGRPHLMGKWPWYVNLFFNINERVMLKLSNKVTVVAFPLYEIYRGLGNANVEYIPNGINLNQPVSNSDIPYKDYILFAAGRIIPLKGCHVLLEALKLMNYTGKVVVIGDLEQMPSYKEKLLNLAEGLDVTFISLIRDKAQLLNYVKNARLFVFPSDYENMSIMLLEVVYVKTPLICSDIAPNKVIFSDDEVLFFKTNDASDLKEKITFAIQNPKKMQAFMDKAFELLKLKYNWESIAKTYDGVFEKYLN
ncbi:MAG: glycosyltransferase family 4 protein [Bacteroidota bacterium]|nr:glycosyltransferase family 4 protein [Bacteroidota bacterium]